MSALGGCSLAGQLLSLVRFTKACISGEGLVVPLVFYAEFLMRLYLGAFHLQAGAV